MEPEKRQDDALAALTDALLAGQDPVLEMDDNMQGLAKVVQDLERMIPQQEGAPAQLRVGLARSLGDEFDRMQREEKMLQIQQRRVIRLISAAAAVVLVAMAALILSDGGDQQGTAEGTLDGPTFVILGVIAISLLLAGAVFYFRERRNSDKD